VVETLQEIEMTESKFSLPKTFEHKTYEIGQLIKVLLSLHKDVCLDQKDIEVEYFDAWDFYKVSIFRWSKNSNGCGTKEYRDKLWESHKTAMTELFEMRMSSQVSWRWKSHTAYVNEDIETKENGSIPGITFFIKAE
jgi:hypothetical protein